MRGGFLHNTVLLAPIAEYLKATGAEVIPEHPVEPGPSPRCVDLLARCHGETLVIEAELTPRRVGSDVGKAATLNADLLLIVTPTRRAAAAIGRRLRILERAGLCSACLEVQVRPLGPAMAYLRTRYRLISDPIHDGKTNHKGGSVRARAVQGSRP